MRLQRRRIEARYPVAPLEHNGLEQPHLPRIQNLVEYLPNLNGGLACS